jgi:hypothetical protein
MAMGPVKDKLLKKAFHEIGQNEPAIVGKTRRKKGDKAANKQRVAIAFSKARRGDV